MLSRIRIESGFLKWELGHAAFSENPNIPSCMMWRRLDVKPAIFSCIIEVMWTRKYKKCWESDRTMWCHLTPPLGRMVLLTWLGQHPARQVASQEVLLSLQRAHSPPIIPSLFVPSRENWGMKIQFPCRNSVIEFQVYRHNVFPLYHKHHSRRKHWSAPRVFGQI